MSKYEPSLEQLLSDPIIHAVMRRDGLVAEDIRSVINQARAHMRPTSQLSCACR
ncbi:hypothetical protein [Magnetospira sp. QH-2]|uniref:hypothetical protein n=1 Tax=Magnetospira sp. (strain QH-2) TaxID=1288970 RepID=UPI0003E81C38